MTTATATRASSAQIETVRNLLAQLQQRGVDVSGYRTGYNHSRTEGTFTEGFASVVIRDLLAEIAAIDARKPEIPSGRYAVLADAGHWAFYRVWVGDRATLVYLQLSDEEQRVYGNQAKTILRKIADTGVLEASKEYGRQIGVCGVCNRTLTNPESVANGIGPVCAGRL